MNTPEQAETRLPSGSSPVTPPPAVPLHTGGGTRPRVYGLDLSLTAAGIASNFGWCNVIGIDGITTMSLRDRDTTIYNLAYDITQLLGPDVDLVVIEAPAFSRAGGGAHERSGLWWRVVHQLHRWDVPVVEVSAGTLKRYATGKGRCDKGAVVEAVTRRWPKYRTNGDHNACDAVVLAAMGADHLGHALAPMPAAHRAALDAVSWPEVAG